MSVGPQTHDYEVNALLWLNQTSQEQIIDFCTTTLGIKRNRLQLNLHLTVYHGRRLLPGLVEQDYPVNIVANASETRFMVLAPGGENPRPELNPRSKSIGIRFTKRNASIPDIQRLRRSIFELETKRVVGSRNPTTAWTNCFGSRHYQPHIQILRPWNNLNIDLTEAGNLFRSTISHIVFDRFQIEFRHRIGGHWISGVA